jgi:integral membrane protein
VTAATTSGLKGAFVRYRVLAIIVGILTPIVVLVATPLDLIWHKEALIKAVGQPHGFLFMFYLVTVFMLGLKMNWSWKVLAWRMAAGIIPFLTFVVERQVAREVNEALTQ